MTTSVARELVRSGHLVCSLRLAPFATSVVAVAAYLLARLGDTPEAIGDLRVVGLLLALGSGYALDDSAAITLQASPYGLARRLWLRTLVGHRARGDVRARGRDARPGGALGARAVRRLSLSPPFRTVSSPARSARSFR